MAHQRDIASALRGNDIFLARHGDFHGATFGGIAADPALLHEDGELVGDRGGGGKAHSGTDFTHGWGVAIGLGGLLDEFKDLELAGG